MPVESELPKTETISDPKRQSPKASRRKRKPGRPTLYNEALAEDLCAKIRAHGFSDTRAALLCGVMPKNLPRWKEAHEGFAEALETARAEFMAEQLQAIMAATMKDGEPNWRARAWLLERTFPAEYGRRAPLKAPEPEPAQPIESAATAEEEEYVITPEMLVELQRRRMAHLRALRAQEEAEEKANKEAQNAQNSPSAKTQVDPAPEASAPADHRCYTTDPSHPAPDLNTTSSEPNPLLGAQNAQNYPGGPRRVIPPPLPPPLPATGYRFGLYPG